MKQHILKKIPLFVTVSVLLACIVFSGCAGRTVITDAQFKSACEAADCEVTDVSDQFDSSVITKALTVSGDDYSLGFFTFASTDSAKTNYAQMLSSNQPEIKAMADKYGVTVPQLCIRYTIQLGTISLPKTANPEHMKSNTEVDFEISAEDMEA